MKTLRWILMLVLLGMMALGSAARAANNSDSPEVVVQGLYHSAMKHSGFTVEAIKASQPWLTPGLYARLWKKVNEPVAKGDAPDIEMDVFLNTQEPPDKFVLGKTTINSATARVDVMLSLAGADGDKWKVTAVLKQIDSAWKVDDVDYGKDGKLSEILKE